MIHTDIIEAIAASSGYKTYLELGLYKSETIHRVNKYIPDVTGVDIRRPQMIVGKFYEGTTTQFFKDLSLTNSNKTFDLIFIDADHSFASAKEDFFNSLLYLSEGGCIIMHDTDPESDGLFDPGYCGDSYKIVNLIENDSSLNIVTLPITHTGLSIITRKGSTRTHKRHD